MPPSHRSIGIHSDTYSSSRASRSINFPKSLPADLESTSTSRPADPQAMSGGGGRGVDPFGSRPDEILQHVLSFLPSREAVHASQLSRRWRNLRRSTPAIRILPRPSHLIKEDYYFLLFVNGLLLHRDASAPLRSFQIETSLAPPNRHDSDSDDGDGDGYYELEHGEFDRYEGRTLFNLDPHVDLWIAHALSACRARELTVRFCEEDANVVWEPRNPLPFASRHLTALHLDGVRLYDDALLDFTPCAALRDLSLTRCRLAGDKAPFVSPSLERLSIVLPHGSGRGVMPSIDGAAGGNGTDGMHAEAPLSTDIR